MSGVEAGARMGDAGGKGQLVSTLQQLGRTLHLRNLQPPHLWAGRAVGTPSKLASAAPLTCTVLHPCRPPPLRRYGHRSDGLIHLVMVKKCSRLQYLRFLLTLSHSGGCTGLRD